MADTIVIPSPSAFLDSAPPTAPPPPTPDRKPSDAATTNKKTKKSPPKKGRKSLDAADRPGTSAILHKSTAASNGVEKAKPKQTKSRHGCLTCKKRRLKCDEEKPTCKNCRLGNKECAGYKVDFKWRPFEESNVKAQIDRQMGIHKISKSRSADVSKTPTPTTEHPPFNEWHGPIPDAHQKKDSFVSGQDALEFSLAALQPPDLGTLVSPPPRNQQHSTSPTHQLAPQLPHPSISPPRLPSSQPFILSHNHRRVQDDDNGSSSGPLPRLPSHSRSPADFDFLNSLNDPRRTNVDMDMGLEPAFSSPDDVMLQQDFLTGGFNAEDIELIWRGELPPQGLAPFSPMPEHVDLLEPNHVDMSGSHDDDDVAAALHLQQISLEPQDFDRIARLPSPDPTDTDTDALLWRFIHETASIRSVVDGPNENPWRTMVLPLARGSPALTHALVAMAAFHAGYDNNQRMKVAGQQHKDLSLCNLLAGLKDNSMSEEAAIATALALGFAESWETSTYSGNIHIKGAQAMVRKVLERHREQPVQGEALPLLKFLCNAWVYMDVMARLTAVENDESNDFDSAFLFLPGSPNSQDGEDDGFGINFGMPVDARLDPLMGCANTLFPIIGRVANLVRKVCRSQSNSPSTISQARDLKRALEKWQPPAGVDEPEDPTLEIEHCTQTAEAYRWATLLHLHQSVPELPSPSSADLAQKVLQFLATVPPWSPTVVVQTFPLMVAGCEAAPSPHHNTNSNEANKPNNTTSPNNNSHDNQQPLEDADSDRAWVRSRWAKVQERMQIGVLDRCATVTEEVWRRRDAYEKLPSARRKLVITKDLDPPPDERKKSRPLARTETGAWRKKREGGGMGVVFSYVDPAAPKNAGAGGHGAGDFDGGVTPSRDGSVGPSLTAPSSSGNNTNNHIINSSAGGNSKGGQGPNPARERGEKRRDGGDGRRRPTSTQHDRITDPAYTVRGHLHWVGVMWDWGWEVLLG